MSLPALVQVTIFWTIQASALLVFAVPFRWAYVALYAIVRPGDEEAALKMMKIFLESAVPKFEIFVPEKS